MKRNHCDASSLVACWGWSRILAEAWGQVAGITAWRCCRGLAPILSGGEVKASVVTAVLMTAPSRNVSGGDGGWWVGLQSLAKKQRAFQHMIGLDELIHLGSVIGQ